jgi:hypothetical protein
MFRTRLGSLMSVLVVAGCGSSGTSQPIGQSDSHGRSASATHLSALFAAHPHAAGRVASWVLPAAKTAPLAYVSDYEHDSVAIFNATTGAVLGQIGNLAAPAGLFVDGRHRLWVANSGGGDVLIFDRGATSPSVTLSDPNERPFDAVLCPNGTAYVSNYYNFNTGIGGVYVYAKGSTSPTSTLADPNEFQNYFITCDRHNNVFTTLELGNLASQVDEYAGGAAPATKIVGVDSPGGIAVNAGGNLVVDDPDGHRISEYTEAGAATGRKFTTSVQELIFDIAVARNGKTVLGANASGSGIAFSLWSGVAAKTYTTTFVEPLGAAYDPPAKGM